MLHSVFVGIPLNYPIGIFDIATDRAYYRAYVYGKVYSLMFAYIGRTIDLVN
jgi:hypothetical protein